MEQLSIELDKCDFKAKFMTCGIESQNCRGTVNNKLMEKSPRQLQYLKAKALPYPRVKLQ